MFPVFLPLTSPSSSKKLRLSLRYQSEARRERVYILSILKRDMWPKGTSPPRASRDLSVVAGARSRQPRPRPSTSTYLHIRSLIPESFKTLSLFVFSQRLSQDGSFFARPYFARSPAPFTGRAATRRLNQRVERSRISIWREGWHHSGYFELLKQGPKNGESSRCAQLSRLFRNRTLTVCCALSPTPPHSNRGDFSLQDTLLRLAVGLSLRFMTWKWT